MGRSKEMYGVGKKTRKTEKNKIRREEMGGENCSLSSAGSETGITCSCSCCGLGSGNCWVFSRWDLAN